MKTPANVAKEIHCYISSIIHFAAISLEQLRAAGTIQTQAIEKCNVLAAISIEPI